MFFKYLKLDPRYINYGEFEFYTKKVKKNEANFNIISKIPFPQFAIFIWAGPIQSNFSFEFVKKFNSLKFITVMSNYVKTIFECLRIGLIHLKSMSGYVSNLENIFFYFTFIK